MQYLPNHLSENYKNNESDSYLLLPRPDERNILLAMDHLHNVHSSSAQNPKTFLGVRDQSLVYISSRQRRYGTCPARPAPRRWSAGPHRSERGDVQTPKQSRRSIRHKRRYRQRQTSTLRGGYIPTRNTPTTSRQRTRRLVVSVEGFLIMSTASLRCYPSNSTLTTAPSYSFNVWESSLIARRRWI